MNRKALILGALAAALPAAGAAQQFPTTPPTLGAPGAVHPPTPVQRRLANGMKVLYVRQPEIPVVSAVLVVRGAGTTEDPAALPGLATFTASMLDEGAAGKSSLQIADALDLLGASLGTGASYDAATVNLYVLKKNFGPALGIMSDVVLRPDFPANEVQRVRDERVTNLTRAKDEAAAIAGNAFQSLVYGAQHPYGRFATIEATRTLDRDRVMAFHRAAYRPENTTLILVGDVDPATMQPQIERAFGGWVGIGAVPSVEGSVAAPQIGSTTIYLIDKPGAAQSEIRIGHPGVARNTPDYFALQVLNTMLGGAFSSRLNLNLRETHGWTYGARSGFSMRQSAGPFTAQAAVVTAKTDSSIVEFFRELNRIRTEPIPADELDKAKRYVALGFPQQFETNPTVAGRLAELVTYGIDPSFFANYQNGIMAVTAADVKRVAEQYVRPSNAVVVIVGDRSQIEAGLRAINVAPVQVREIGEFVR
ncbi:pitrilysin family protein [Longimicrobium sp.]|uniref:M16 family metallopeptidase n=1 Tax=Longimicrobium sp. TaxID=2029185 RepID=UPI002BA864FA|nr:pitrilysin family protein [Longimicrobium sp.]HSU14778.1 pitrilysin family protein [Longimicrobium sp.]